MPKRATTEEFVANAKLIHGDRYDYSKVDYQGRHKHVTIVCSEHGEFSQKPVYHTLREAGCPLCANFVCPRDTFDDFVAKANNTHGGIYSYSAEHYTCSTEKTTITCKVHGNFKQLPYMHIYGQGCPTCATGPQSRSALAWLSYRSKVDGVDIRTTENGGEYLIPGTKYKVDGFCALTNTVYEFHGDFWHGNPNTQDPNAIHPVCNRTMGELYERTIAREKVIKALGYNLITIWESDWNKLRKSK